MYGALFFRLCIVTGLCLLTKASTYFPVQGEIPILSDLPAPWGPKPYVPNEADAALAPAKFPAGFSPLKDTAVA